MTSNLKLYFDTPSKRWTLQYERNFIIEDIEEFLSDFTSYIINDFQYQKIDLDMDCKVPASQLYQLPLSKYSIRYASITEGDNTYYFYVLDSEWISQSAIRLKMRLDSLNTFKYGSDYEVSGETHISRRFKDRFERKSYVSEGISQLDVTIPSSQTTFGKAILQSYYGSTNYNGSVTLPLSSTMIIDGVAYRVLNGSITVTGTRTTTTITYYNGAKYSGRYIGDEDDHTFTGELSFTSIGIGTTTMTSATGSVNYIYARNGNYNVITLTISFNGSYSETSTIGSRLQSFTRGNIYFNNTSTYCYCPSSLTLEIASISTSTTETFDGGSITAQIQGSVDISSTSEISVRYVVDNIVYSQVLSPSYTYSVQSNASTESFYYKKIVDWFPEEVNPPLYKRREENINDSTNGFDWYLIVRNQDEASDTHDNPVIMDVCASSPLIYNTYSGDYLLDASIITTNIGASQILLAHRWTKSWISTLKSIKNQNNDYIFTSFIDDNTTQMYILVTPQSDGTLLLEIVKTSDGLKTTTSYTADWITYGAEYKLYYTTESYLLQLFDKWYNSSNLVDTSINGRSIVPLVASTNLTITSTQTIDSIDAIDRTDTRFVKIFKLPYIFMGGLIKADSNEVYLPLGASLDTITKTEGSTTTTMGTFIQVAGASLEEGEVSLISTITADNSDPAIYDIFLNEYVINEDDLFDIDGENSNELESKLLNSEFFLQKIVYDSFNYSIRLENLAIPDFEDTSGLLSFTFQMSNTINSNFLIALDYTYKYTQDDYENIMIISRNNELPLFNNDYITYLNTGYNYDVKNKNIRVTQDWINTGLNAGSSVASALAKPTPSNIVRQSVGVAKNIVSNISNQLIAENNINKRIIESQYQPTSVYGSDDIDLLSTYTNNRAKICYYTLSEEFRRLVIALFHYQGYRCNEYGVPNTHTRSRFDFIQAEIVFDSVLNFSLNVKNDIINKWGEGVYFIHHYRNEWDTTLKYENYEVSIVG